MEQVADLEIDRGAIEVVLPATDGPDAADASSAGRRERWTLVALYSLAAFVSATLVFLVQPMVTKLILPRLGGSPSVWNTSLVFFQAMLLVGYAYAHVTTHLLPLRTQARAHLVVLAAPLLLLPISVPGWRPPTTGAVAPWVLVLLLVVAGAPYAAVSTASPLLQRWFSTTRHPAAADPYFLYAAGNAGSILGLVVYPALIEPNFSLAGQARLWTAGYGLFLGLALLAALTVRAHTAPMPRATTAEHRIGDTAALRIGSATPTWSDRARWVLLAFVPSSLLVGSTTHLSVDVASVPLLWVAPLTAYLLTFVVTFARRRLIPTWFAALFAPGLIGAVGARMAVDGVTSIGREIVLHLVTLFVVGLVCHGRLADERPPTEWLTEFFLLVSVGGVLGGVFNALVAPVVFDRLLEYPIVLAAALLALPRRRIRARARPVHLAIALALIPATGWMLDYYSHWMLWTAVVVLTLCRPRPFLAAGVAAALFGVMLSRAAEGYESTERTFFGTLSVANDGTFRTLSHGTTLHGQQFLEAEKRAIPTTYYAPSGPVGRTFEALDGDPRLDRVGVVGLGVGTVASYNKAGRHLTYFEIDKAVVDYATDRRWFTYVPDAAGTVDIVLGDARLSLAKAAPQSFGLLALDAFSSDAIPVHLLTREAFETYFRALRSDGILLVHVSNRYLDLEPVVSATARDLGYQSWTFDDGEMTEQQEKDGKALSKWLAVGKSYAALSVLQGHGPWTPSRADPAIEGWTDQASDLWSVLIL